MIAEAVDAAVSVGWALAVWVLLMAVVATAALYAVVVTAVCAVLAVWRGVAAVLSLVQHSGGGEVVREVPEAADAHAEPHVPSWARSEEEAA